MTHVIFIWHFHQPYYGLPDSDEFLLPWTRLHAAKSYYDMGRLLEDHPKIRATFNFSGSLTRQLTEYEEGRRDRWVRWSLTDPGDLSVRERRDIIRHFFSIDADRHIEPVDRYRELYRRRQTDGITTCADEFDHQDFLDLQVLFNLGWCGFSARDDFPVVEQLRDKGRDFTTAERDELLDVHLQIVDRILPLYRTLADRGQIEVTTTPMYHPILPLLIDTDSAARATPERPRPARYTAPDDAAWHIAEGLDTAEEAFGRRPCGMWPAEGSVSPEAVELFAGADVEWIAGDEAILKHSRGDQFHRDDDLWRPWRLGDTSPRIFFRDRGLSDRIGFAYASNPPERAADDLMGHFRAIDAALGHRSGCIPVILDGENPWEYYDDDGRPFLSALYDRLDADDDIDTALPSDIDIEPGQLDHLHSGSWIDANFRIWIGHRETNTGWQWLRRAAEYLAEVAEDHADHANLDLARQHLRIAQGSDWFWWYGDDFHSEQDEQFDALFRALVCGVWTTLGDDPPAELSRPIRSDEPTTAGDEALHIPPRRQISPIIDGRGHKFFEWIGAGEIAITGAHGSMFETLKPLDAIRYGFSNDRLFLRLEPGDDFTDDSRFDVTLRFDDTDLTVSIPSDTRPDDTLTAFDDVAELSVSLTALNAEPGDPIELTVSVVRDGIQLQRFPDHGRFTLNPPHTDHS